MNRLNLWSKVDMDVSQNYPILDFDPDPHAIIEPRLLYPDVDLPEHCVVCFFNDVIKKIVKEYSAKTSFSSEWENGSHLYYEIEYKGQRLGFIHPGVGAAIAGSILEEVITFGSRKIIACGGSGVLNPEIAVGHLLIPQFAYRDEGMSYHYMEPSEKVAMNPSALSAIQKVLDEKKIPYILSSTWTTDAPYRETKSRATKFKSLGCATVEMETAAFMAVADFHKAIFGQILYGGDLVIDDGWDSRSWQSREDIRENLFWLAADACLAITEEEHA
jgi:uridine phosphorylase